MRIISVKNTKPKKRHHSYGRWCSIILLLILITGVFNFVRPLPAIPAEIVSAQTYAAKPINLAWPSYGQAAIATTKDGVLASNGSQTPLATASIAKVITALCILEKYPLAANQTGPTLTLTDSDVLIHDNYVNKDGSVVAVTAGEQLTEYELLEAMMLPSANNLADSGAIWAYGSLDQYITYANTFLATHGLTDTHVAVDASGFDGATTSTASDLARLGSLAIAQPALKTIVGQTTADLPVVGTVYNYNGALGQQGIFGIKTGNNDQDTGAFLFAANLDVGSTTKTVTGAVMGAGSLSGALQSALTLLASTGQNFSNISISTKGQVFTTYRAPWGATAHAVASSGVDVQRWNGNAVRTTISASPITASKASKEVGKLQVAGTNASQSSSLVLDHPLARPSFWWRLTRH